LILFWQVGGRDFRDEEAALVEARAQHQLLQPQVRELEMNSRGEDAPEFNVDPLEGVGVGHLLVVESAVEPS